MKLRTKILIGIDIIILACFIFVYAINSVKVFWITTSMETASHRYLAYIFYSENTVKKVLDNNYLIEFQNGSNASKVEVKKAKKQDVYESIYEQQILEHDENDLYKLIQFKYGDFDCYLVAIYDPTRVQAVANTPIGKGKILSDISKENDAIVAINGGGYSWATNMPTGLIIHNGEVVYAQNYGEHLIAGFNSDGVLVIGNYSAHTAIENNIREALTFGPALIIDGTPATIKGTGGSGLNPRTVIAQRQDGIVLFLVVNGYGQNLSWKGRGGVYYNDLITILKRYKAYNAMNMDGGSSTTLVINHQLINSPCEPQKEGQDFIKTAWILK